MNETVKMIFGLIGGLALFLYGMNNMSDALQKTAGERMKSILGFLINFISKKEKVRNIGMVINTDSTVVLIEKINKSLNL